MDGIAGTPFCLWRHWLIQRMEHSFTEAPPV
jgi:hypothetical protein